MSKEYFIGDYVKFKTKGGIEREGIITKVYSKGLFDIIPDAAKNPIGINKEQIIELLREGRKRKQIAYKKEHEIGVPWSNK